MASLGNERGDLTAQRAKFFKRKFLNVRCHWLSPSWIRCFCPPLAGKPMIVERWRAQRPHWAQVTPCVLVGQITTVRPFGVFVFFPVPAGGISVNGATPRLASSFVVRRRVSMTFLGEHVVLCSF